MSKMRVVGIALAVGAALGAFTIAKSFMGNKPSPEVVEQKVESTEVLVAAKDIQMGEKFAAGTLIWKAWPKDAVVPAMIVRDQRATAKEDLEKARARIAIFEGEPVNDRKVISPDNPGFMSAILPKGMRAIAVGVSEQSGAGGFILPNDRVDVLLTRKVPNPDTGKIEILTETVLKNVRVLAINQTFRKEQGPDGDQVTVSGGKTATLELSPSQTEVIQTIASSGELSLALRSIAEIDGKKISEVMPEVTPGFEPNGKKRSADETLVVRYGVEKYTANQ